MKKAALIFGSILFSILFYKQDIGLNLTLFSLFTIGILAIYNPIAFKQKTNIGFSIIYIMTAICIFIYKSQLSIIANAVAFLTLIGHISQPKTSLYINWLNGMYTLVAAFFHRNFNIKQNEEALKPKKDMDYIHWIKIIGIPAIVVVVFTFLYKDGNPVFNKLISNINLNFINLQWILMALFGFYILYNISAPIQINHITEIDLNTSNTLENNTSFSIENVNKENQLGFILITLLNILIAIFLITDVTYLMYADTFKASDFSNQVHSSINALIASIIIAIAIILYFFRGDLNFFKGNKNLKIVAYIWIILNAFLIINIVIKDCQYIHYFGFTYKRMGVLIYLLLTTIGLATTYIKVNKIKNFWYLLRINSVTAFTILIISCTINWDRQITYFNLNYAQSIDFNYLINLSNNNTFILEIYAKQNKLSDDRKSLVDEKYNKYKQELDDKNWQELSYDNFKKD